MEYLKVFDTEAQYDAYVNSGEYEIPNVSLVAGETVKYNIHDYSKDYFTVKALGSGTIVWHRKSVEVPSYRINGGEWTSNPQASSYNIPVNENDEVEFSFNPSSDSSLFYQFLSVNTDYEVYGNIFSLMYGDDFSGKTTFEKNIIFRSMFYNDAHLVSAENLILPATTVIASAYTAMFWSSSKLEKAPVLPATNLAAGCYSEMFRGCPSLTTAPELPATTLAPYCYFWMFGYCHSLTTAPELPATTLAPYCYYMMFQNCVGLTEVPELSATILSQNCYRQMFQDCSNLSYIKCLATGTDTQGMPVTACTDTWIQGVSETGTFVKNAQMQDWPQEYGNHSGIPNGWTVQDAS